VRVSLKCGNSFGFGLATTMLLRRIAMLTILTAALPIGIAA